MKQFLLMIGLCISLTMTARDFTYEGIKYTVIDDVNKYVETKAGYSETVDEETKYYAGNEVGTDKLVLPSKVYEGNTEYTLTRIGDISFYSSGISELTVPETVLEIGDYAFGISISLAKVTLPEEMESIGEHAFAGCMSLSEIKLPNIASIKPFTFAICLSLEGIVIPQSVKTIGDAAFSMSALKAISLPDVRVLGDMTFYSCANLEKIELGDALVDMGSRTFSGCSDIKSVHYNSDSPIFAFSSIFDDAVYTDATLYVPTGTISKFEKKAPWYNFAKIKEFDFVALETIEASETSEPEYYDLKGNRISEPYSGQIVIKHQGGKSTKVIIP